MKLRDYNLHDETGGDRYGLTLHLDMSPEEFVEFRKHLSDFARHGVRMVPLGAASSSGSYWDDLLNDDIGPMDSLKRQMEELTERLRGMERERAENAKRAAAEEIRRAVYGSEPPKPKRPPSRPAESFEEFMRRMHREETARDEAAKRARAKAEAEAETARRQAEEAARKAREEAEAKAKRKAERQVFGWRAVLGEHSTLEAASKAYRALAKKHHTDVGGDLQTMVRINRAFEAAKKEFEQ